MSATTRQATINQAFDLRGAELRCQAAASPAQRLAHAALEYGKARACGDTAAMAMWRELGHRAQADADGIEYSVWLAGYEEYRREVVTR